MAKYTIGLDYGTLSGRAVLVDVSDGRALATAVYDYPHAVMTESLPDGTPLPPDWALQHPQDYLDVLYRVIPEVMQKSGVSAADVIGIGVDFTSCTVLPVDKNGLPLCFMPAWEHNPYAYVMLWKHHAGQRFAEEITRIAQERREPWLANYGGKVSSELSLPKLWQVLDEAPDVYAAMDEWIEAGDWIVWQLTGNDTKNSCAAGYKCLYNKRTGYPSEDFFAALDPRLRHVLAEKYATPVTPIGQKAGELTAEAAQKLGLLPGTAVAIANVDAHACVPAVGMSRPGQMLAIMGTSTCHMSLSTVECQVPGMCGVVEDGMMPGFLGYEAGQSCVGDHFAWFCERCVPADYLEAAKACGLHIQQYLTELAQRLRPGESGLLALDWWNGNRSVLADFDLTGLMLGMTLQTKPEEMYRALIEATAYGTRMIVENYRAHGVAVDTFFASGGISQKNAMAMQIYADVLNMPIHIADASQGPALGSAIFGAVAAGAAAGGYDDMTEAVARMAAPAQKVYQPQAESVAVYDRLFAEYRLLHDYFGRGGNDVMKRLKKMKQGE